MDDISVIMPAHNARRFIAEAIESALAQTRPPLEVVVVDDASSDDTAAVAEAFGEPVKVLRQLRNTGPGACRNAGVRASRGEYLAFLDADDAWEPDHLEKLSSLLAGSLEVGLAFSQKQNCGGDGGVHPVEELLLVGPTDYLPGFMRDILCASSMMMIPRDIFNALGGFPEDYRRRGGRRIQIEDFKLALLIATRYDVVALHEPTVRYRVHSGQSTDLEAWQALEANRFRVSTCRGLIKSGISAQRAALLRDRILMCHSAWMLRLWTESRYIELRTFAFAGMFWGLKPITSFLYLLKSLLPAKFVFLKRTLTKSLNA